MQYLQTLGGLELISSGGGVTPLGGRAAALLILLMQNAPRPVDRDELIWLLWDSRPTASNRHSLSQLLYKLKWVVKDAEITASNRKVSIGVAQPDHDLRRFNVAMSAGDYLEAVQIYRGRFLEGFGHIAGRNFEEWQSTIGADTDRKVVRALLFLASSAETAGDWESALGFADRIVQLDPINESANILYLRMLCATRPDIVAAAEAARLRATYAAWDEPLPAVLSTMLEAIDRSASMEGRVDRNPPQFVGRAMEFGLLCRAWQTADVGTAHVVQITGPAGIGKTRLVERFLRWAVLKDARVLQTDCSPAEQRIALAGISSALSDGVTASDLSVLERGWQERLGSLMPQLTGDSVRPEIRLGSDHRTIFEAAGRLMLALSDRQTVVMFFDNAHWLDDSSAWLVQYLFHKLRNHRALFVLGLRSRNEICSEHLAVFLQTAERVAVTSIEVGELDCQASLSLISEQASRHGLSITSADNAAILSDSKGIPFRIVERVKEAAARFKGADHPGASGANVRSGMLERLKYLTPLARESLDALAILGRTASTTVLGQVLPTGGSRLPHALAELEEHDLIRTRGRKIRFVHDLILEHVISEMEPGLRENLHEKVGKALRLRAAAKAGLLTLHYAAAGRDEAAALLALSAAQEAYESFAYKDADFYYQLAMNRAPTQELKIRAISEYIDFLCLSERLEDALSWVARWRASTASLSNPRVPLNLGLLELYRAIMIEECSVEELLSRVNRFMEPGRTDESNYRMMRIVLQLAHVAGRVAIADHLAYYLEKHLDELTVSKAGCELLGILARYWAVWIDSTKALDLANEALLATERLGDSAGILLSTVARGTVRVLRGELYEAEKDFDRVLAHAENPELAHFRQRVLNNFGLVQLERGKLAEASSTLYEALGYVSAPDQLMIRSNLAVVSLEEGSFDELGRRVEALERANGVLQVEWPAIFGDTMRGWMALASGDIAQAADRAWRVHAQLDGSVTVIDPSYSEMLIARAMTLTSPDRAVRYCHDRSVHHRRRYVLSALRLELEGARATRSANVDDARSKAQAVLGEAETLGASNIAKQAVGLISSF